VQDVRRNTRGKQIELIVVIRRWQQ